MRSTYSRAMTGSTVSDSPIKRPWVYGTVAALLVGSAVLARDEAVDLLRDPIGAAIIIAIAAGFIARRSMALTPWGLVSGAIILYGLERATETIDPVLGGARFLLLVAAVVVSILQLRVRLSGHAAHRPARTRWGAVMVAATACLVVLALSRPDIQVIEWIRDDPIGHTEARAPVLRGDYVAPTRAGRLEDASIVESSGLVAGRKDPAILWTHNDSGDGPFIYCLQKNGASCGTWEVTGAAASDWEDIAAGPGPEAQNYLYIGDIGDNERTRDSITVYRVPEPMPPAGADPSLTAPAEAITLVYPGKAHDAETLLIHPSTGDLYIVTKEVSPRVYTAAAPLDAGDTIRLEKLTSFSIFGTLSDPTGGDISADGRRVAIATYGGWYEFVLSPGTDEASFDDIWDMTPALIGNARTGQTEAIAYAIDGAVYMTSEGKHTPLLRAERRE